MATPTSLPATFVAGNVLTAAQMNDLRGAFRILQVVSTTKTDTYSVSVGLRQFAGSNVTGLDTTITPSSTSSKILVIPMIYCGGTTARAIFRINRGGSPIAVGDAAGNRSLATGRNYGFNNNGEIALGSMMHLDAPATTSATTYGVELFNDASGTETLYVNRSGADSDVVQTLRTVSSLTLLEVSA